ncbi:hypothetical protein C7120_09215 [Prevotella sp. oral taxon 376]|uniref:hypothetical protein n=1 Tax=Prevotella sp. oral taxon 376 TaxID=712466 RepID=UPI000D1F3A31|nr:hypothetical protein [Prevotella sp. oral taxon 376]PTL32531.1 hypothetical protein C7120_09400 [Prevotella sp. oral taxon 376]PTL34668.1 hypothetical protein C7120_09215 [Prevotella sp. oral taxon 376]
MIDVYDIIKQINKQKAEAHKFPISANFNEVMGEVTAQVKSEINQMVSENKITYNQTLNSFSFEVIDDIFNQQISE